MRALLLKVGDVRFTVELTAAREVLRRPLITPLPGATSPVIGIFNLRGEIVPAFDSAILLNASVVSDLSYLVVVDTIAGPAALTASTMGAVVELGECTGPPNTPGEQGSYSVIDDAESEPVQLLDLDGLLLPLHAGG